MDFAGNRILRVDPSTGNRTEISSATVGTGPTFSSPLGMLSGAVASIAVNAVNDIPVATAQSVTTPEDVAKAITLAGTDIEASTLTYTVVANPAKGTLSGTAPDLTYTPNLNYNGADSFTFKVNDGTVDSLTATVSITVTDVDDAPLAARRNVTTPEDTPVGIALEGNDSDSSSNSFAFTIISQPGLGKLTGSGSSWTFTPNPNVSGRDSFRFRLSDGASFSEAEITIDVLSVNDAPTLNAISDLTVYSDGAAHNATLSGATPGGGADEASQTVAITASSGSPSILPNPTITNAGGVWTMSVLPTENAEGSSVVTVTVRDSGALGGGSVNTSTQTFSVTVKKPSGLAIRSAATYPPDPRTIEGPIETRIVARGVATATFSIAGVARASAVPMMSVGAPAADGYQTWLGTFVVVAGDENVTDAASSVTVTDA
ncbi:MAG: Ig-like domain-containing protein, partial [Candidatus Poribacteria bacterium]|nr:Ig-like domain-containing protein [Candidatus Poribacteria bacterium]